MARPEPPLSGYTVIDLSTGIAGAYCTKLLADGGAKIIKVEPPEGDPLRRWSSSGAAIQSRRDGALFGFLAGGKASVIADPEVAQDIDMVTRLLAGADAVVWSAGSKVAEHQRFTPSAMHVAHPQLTVTSITPFGLQGPWRDRAATEFTLQAWSGGIVGLGRGSPDRAPVFVGGQVGEYLAGAYASAATLASRFGRIDGGAGELVDLSMLEDANPLPHLLPGHLFRNARTAVARCPATHRAWCRPGERRSGGPRLWDRAAVVRPVRDGRPPGVDRREIAVVDHRAGQHPCRRDLCLGGKQSGRRDPGPGDGIPDPQRAGRQRRQHRVARPLSSAPFVPAQPARPIPAAGPPLSHATRATSAAACGATAG